MKSVHLTPASEDQQGYLYYNLNWDRGDNAAGQLALMSFTARGPRSWTQVYVGNTGSLWRWGTPWVERHGQLSVCQPGREAHWCSIYVHQGERLAALELYATAYHCNVLEAHLLYAKEHYKQTWTLHLEDIELGQVDEDLITLADDMQTWSMKLLQRPTLFGCNLLQSMIRQYKVQRHLLVKRVLKEELDATDGVLQPVTLPEENPHGSTQPSEV